MRLKNRFLSLLLAFILVIGCTVYSGSMVYADTTTTGNYQVFEGSLGTASDTNTYNVTIDSSVTTSSAICLVQTGNATIKAVVTDSSGNTITSLNTSKSCATSWFVYNEPGLTSFNITVSSTYFDTNSNYRVMVGNKSDIEAMLGGIDNTVILKTFVNSQNNYYYGNYIPNTQEQYFKFIAQSTPSAITLLSNYSQLRFMIIDPSSLSTIYDSNNDTSATRTTYIGYYSYAQKKKISTLTLGQEYYLVLYTPVALQSPGSLLQGYFNLAVGEANMGMGNSIAFYSNSSITGTPTAFSPSAVITTSNVPKTAVATKVYCQSKTSGIHMSDINIWRAKRADSSSWMTSLACYPSITVPYSYGSSSNKIVLGNWNFSFEPYSSNVTFQPGLSFDYNYELGD